MLTSEYTENMAKNRDLPVRKINPKVAQREFGILKLIHSTGQISRIDLAKQTGASVGSLTAIANNLIASRVVVESGAGATALGRKPVLLQVRDDLAYFVGVDLGTYYLRVVVVDVNGHLIYKAQRKTELAEGRVPVLRRTFQAIHEAIAASNIPQRFIRGIGIGHSAVVDSVSGVIISVPRPGQLLEWRNVPLRKMVQEEFGLPCNLHDSVRAIAFAEKRFGLGRRLDDFIYIDGGMGFGAAIFIGGEIYRGAGGGAGEFGHLTVEDRGPLCCCGNSGCLEAVATCAAIIQAAKAAISQGVNSKINELVQGDLDQITLEYIVQAARENDSLAFRVLNDAISHISVALSNVINLLNPTTIIFGGALFRADPNLLVDPLRRFIKQRALEKPANEVHFKVSSLGSEAGALGAARLISEQILEDIYFGNE
jgi:predicted NBD/HSP70 family sugar kinase